MKELLEWCAKLWPIEACNSERDVRAIEKELGHALPDVLRQFYLRTSLRSGDMLSVQELGNVGVSGGGVVFAHDPDASMFWAIPLDKLREADPPLVYGVGGDWEADDSTLVQFLRFFAAVNRPYAEPCCTGRAFATSRLTAPWQRCGVSWKSMQHPELWTNGEAVLDEPAAALGARTGEALHRAAASLDIDLDETLL